MFNYLILSKPLNNEIKVCFGWTYDNGWTTYFCASLVTEKAQTLMLIPQYHL